MPASPTTKSTARRAGAPKARGSVRAKSGCYTCRIRRKKCDEKQDHNGQCETCTRLRLQCLGFGAKRPDWLRDSNTVNDLREKIKRFLSTNGMIKGHSGVGSHDGPTTLILAPSQSPPPASSYSHTSSSESPNMYPTPLDEPGFAMPMSDVRTIPNPSPWLHSPPSNYAQNGGLLPPQSIESSLYRPDSPFGSYSHSSSSDHLHHSYNALGVTSASLDRPINRQPTPVNSSSFGPSYHFPSASYIEDEELQDNGTIEVDEAQQALMPLNHSLYLDLSFLPHSRTEFYGTGFSDELLCHYMEQVIPLQYMLSDRNTLSRLIISSVANEGAPLAACRLLAAVHCKRQTDPHYRALGDASIQEKYSQLRALLEKRDPGQNDAMAAVNTISTFLFDGGGGEWERWLNLSAVYASLVCQRYPSSALAFQHSSQTDRFIITTTIWFDVLASVTRHRPPFLLSQIRELFNPNRSGLYDVSDPTDEVNILSVMGCENAVVWAWAEISNLASWKEDQQHRGRLSIPRLVEKAAELEQTLSCPTSPAVKAAHPVRYHTSEIFRLAAKAYLHIVVSGDYINVDEIQTAVGDTIRYYADIFNSQPLSQSHIMEIIRSTVVALFLCGAFTTEFALRDWILTKLNVQGAGNCRSVAEALKEVWARRSSLNDPVPWREILGDKKLLLV